MVPKQNENLVNQ